MPKSANITLPLPPSINSSYVTDFSSKRRHLSQKAKKYKRNVSFLLKKERVSFKGSVFIAFIFYFPDKRRRYITNHFKIVEDCLVQNKIIVDDSFVHELMAHKHISKDDPRLELFIEDLELDFN